MAYCKWQRYVVQLFPIPYYWHMAPLMGLPTLCVFLYGRNIQRPKRRSCHGGRWGIVTTECCNVAGKAVTAVEKTPLVRKTTARRAVAGPQHKPQPLRGE